VNHDWQTFPEQAVHAEKFVRVETKEDSLKRYSSLVVVLGMLFLFGCVLPDPIPSPPLLPNPGSLIWSDNFESYDLGQFPSTFWTGSGNAGSGGSFVDDNKASSGMQSFRVVGTYAGCWEAIVHRPLAVSPPFTIEFKFYASGEGAGGCHDHFVSVNLTSDANWNSYGRALVSFELDGMIRSGSSNNPQPSHELGSYSLNTWNTVRIRYDETAQGFVNATYWLNGQYLDEIEVAEDSWYHNYVGAIPEGTILSYLGFTSGDSKTWFDDIKVWKD
jgi:hypothetical protein